MNRKSKQFEEEAVRAFGDGKITVSQLARKLKCSSYAVGRILKDHNLKPAGAAELGRIRKHGEITDLYTRTRDVKTVLKAFARSKDAVYRAMEELAVEIDDRLISGIFITAAGGTAVSIAKSTLRHFSGRAEAGGFEEKVMDYLRGRYDDSESPAETIARIHNGIETRPVCRQCGGKLQYCDVNAPFQQFCSRKCANGNEETKFRMKQTCMERYGAPCSSKAESVKQAYRDRMEKKYGKGVVNAFQAKAVIEKLQQTKLDRYGSRTYNNRSKAEQTCMERYGVAVSSQNQIVKDRIVCSQNAVFTDKYGAKRPFQNAEVLREFQESMRRKFGSPSYFDSADFREQCLERYGCRNPMQNPNIRRKQQRRYVYDGVSFDSAPEIAFYVWLSDVKGILGLDFEYSPDVRFRYEFAGREHFYMPDFRVEGQYFEIKGDHFFRPDGTMFNPFRDPSWSDADYAAECARYEAKRRCMAENGVIILKNADYAFFVDYAEGAYGKGYLGRFKNPGNIK